MFKDKQAITFRLIELAALLSVVLLTLSTRWGPGVAGDATIYITSARSLVEGRGLGLPEPLGGFRLLPYFPPFFSLVLSLFGFLGINMVEAARWLNIFCFAALVYLVGSFTFRFSKNAALSILAAWMIALSPVLIPVYAWAMSEPLSALLGFGGLLLTVYAIQYPGKPGYLALAAALTGLSFLTRYSAVAFVMSAALGLLFFSQEKRAKRLLTPIMFGIIGCIPMGVWLVYDFLNTTTVGSRRVLTLPDMISRFFSFWPPLNLSILFWMIPDSWVYTPVYPSKINAVLLLLALLLLAVWVVLIALKFRKNGASITAPFKALLFLITAFIVIYFAAIFGVYLTTYPPITIANRMLSPLYTAFIWLTVMLAILTGMLWPKRTAMRKGITGLLIIFCLIYGWRSARLIKDYYSNGIGYTSPAWQQSQTMDAVRKLPAGALIVTNETTAVQFLADRPAYPLLEIYNDKPADSFSRYGDGNLKNDSYQQLFLDGKAVLVLFDTIDDQISGLYGDRTSERITDLVKGLDQTYRGSDGGVFTYPKSQ